jgi:hypothetical protein
LPVAIPKLNENIIIAKANTGINERVKLLGNNVPVTLNNIACGVIVSNNIIMMKQMTSTTTNFNPNLILAFMLFLLINILANPLLFNEPNAKPINIIHTSTGVPTLFVNMPKNHLIPSPLIRERIELSGIAAAAIHDPI